MRRCPPKLTPNPNLIDPNLTNQIKALKRIQCSYINLLGLIVDQRPTPMYSSLLRADRGLKAHSGTLQLARRYPSKGYVPKSMSC